MPTYTPKNCVFEATLACNLRCQHCGSRAGKARGDELSTQEAIHVFEELAGLGCERITISGGEPTLRADWRELIAGAAKTGMRVALITNGLLWNVQSAQAAKAAGLNAVGFSLDGLRSAHDRIRGKVGHFEHIVRAMDASVAAGVPWASVTFINALNLHELGDMYELLADHGAFAWQVQLGTDMGNLKDNPELLVPRSQLRELEGILVDLVKRGRMRVDIADSIGYHGEHEVVLRSSVHRGRKRSTFGGCGAGMRVIGIESNGNVKGCLSIMAGYNEEGKDYVEGNVRERSLTDIWNDPNAFAYNRQWTLDQLSGFCRECKHATSCRGGCFGKRAATHQPGEYSLCLYRIACETAAPQRRLGHAAAAALLAGSLVGLGTACNEADDPDPMPTSTESGTSTDTDTADTNPQPEYGIPDTDPIASDTPAYGMPEYGIPDTNVDEYGLPDTVDTNVAEYGVSETDTDVTLYMSPPFPD